MPYPSYTLQDAIDYARVILRDSSSALTDADAVSFANDFETKMRKEMVVVRKSLWVREGTLDITANEIVGGSSPGVFMLPPELLLIREIQFDFAGTGDYRPCSKADASNLPDGMSLDWIRKNADAYNPQVDFKGDCFEVFPTPKTAVIKGVSYQGHERPEPFTAATDDLEYPFTQDMEALAYGIAAIYDDPLSERGKTLMAEAMSRVKITIDLIGQGSQMPTKVKPVDIANCGWMG